MKKPGVQRSFVAPRFIKNQNEEGGSGKQDAPHPVPERSVQDENGTFADNTEIHKPSFTTASITKTSTQPLKKPLSRQQMNQPAVQAAKPSLPQSTECMDSDEYFSVLYIKKESFIKKKASKAFLDGVFVVNKSATLCTLHSQDTGKVVSSGKAQRVTMKQILGPAAFSKPAAKNRKKGKGGNDYEGEDDEDDGDAVRYLLGTFVIEVQQPITSQSFRSGACFAPAPAQYGATSAAATSNKLGAGFKRVMARPAADAGVASRPAAPKSLYDPTKPGSVVLNEVDWRSGLEGKSPPVAAVVVDPYVARHLRLHQVEGVRFMYQCVMGGREPGHSGCILADEMGLGKTLQVITLIWTLLKQGPTGRPVAGKVIVVTPASLCSNWDKEVKSWLGSERLQTFILGQATTKDSVQQFKHGLVTKLCITSYETLRKHAADLAGTFDLLVCDEGHRLKSIGGTKTTEALLQLNCQRRVLLTGTPVQNNLEEFYALLSFVAPDLLGSAAAFRKIYAEPIARSQDRDAGQEAKDLGSTRAAELNRKVSSVLLRRTQAILTRHLPPLTNYVLFCKPTQLQVSVYQSILKRVLAAMASGAAQDETLAAITATASDEGEQEDGTSTKQRKRTRKAEPGIAAQVAASRLNTDLDDDDDGGEDQDGNTKRKGHLGSTAAAAGVPSSWAPPSVDLQRDSATASGKLAVLQTLLESAIAKGDRMVVVSTSTAALDAALRLVIAPMGLKAVRIDGSTSVDDRQNIVDSFNTRGVGQVFLLSTRSGGAGLNLIGANHLVLLDSDWNPAADLQAMARIWRDGQRKSCHVWRLLTTGTIEEKVYQRQIMKSGLATATIAKGEAADTGRQFTRDELRALFVLTTNTSCETRDLLKANTAVQPHVRWVDASDAALPTGASPCLQPVMAAGNVSAASVALKSEELSATQHTQQSQHDVANTISNTASEISNGLHGSMLDDADHEDDNSTDGGAVVNTKVAVLHVAATTGAKMAAEEASKMPSSERHLHGSRLATARKLCDKQDGDPDVEHLQGADLEQDHHHPIYQSSDKAHRSGCHTTMQRKEDSAAAEPTNLPTICAAEVKKSEVSSTRGLGPALLKIAGLNRKRGRSLGLVDSDDDAVLPDSDDE